MTRESRRARADLHVHSYHSGYAAHLTFLRTRDCYSDPADVYRVAKARGMDFVTITDHDSIDGCLEFLGRHPDTPDFFISEEIECRFPNIPLKLHIGAYGINERIHAELQPLRSNARELVAFLRQENVPFALNHMFFFFRRQMPLHEYVSAVLELFPAFEVRNGAMHRSQNELIADVVQGRTRSAPAGLFGGSDAHTLRRVATSYTEADGRTPAEFLQSLREGRTRVGGRHGSTFDIAAEIYGVIGHYWTALAGVGRRDLSWRRRAIGGVWSVASLPVDFVPFLVAAIQKNREIAKMTAIRRELGLVAARDSTAAGVVGAES